MEDVAVANPMEDIENLGAPEAEAEVGAALDSAIVEAKAVGAVITEENTEVLTIESSLEWRGTLIEEETETLEEREDSKIGNIPSTSTADLETIVPQRKRRRSREEIQASQPVSRRRTRSMTKDEAT